MTQRCILRTNDTRFLVNHFLLWFLDFRVISADVKISKRVNEESSNRNEIRWRVDTAVVVDKTQYYIVVINNVIISCIHGRPPGKNALVSSQEASFCDVSKSDYQISTNIFALLWLKWSALQFQPLHFIF